MSATAVISRTFGDRDAQTLEVMGQVISASLGNAASKETETRLSRGRTDALTALEESEERFRMALEHAPIGMAVVALDGRWLEVNRAMCQILGRTEESLLAKLATELEQAQRSALVVRVTSPLEILGGEGADQDSARAVLADLADLVDALESCLDR